MRLLVTGGAGFIGANFVNYWLKKHSEDYITVVDSLTYASDLKRLKVSFGCGRLVLLPLDIRNYKAMLDAMKDIDVVVHFAAETHVDRSLAGFEAEKLFMRTNYEGTMSLLHATKDAGVKRFHHVSTDEVFGDLEFDSKQKFHENFCYNAQNPYSISKAAADFGVRAFSRIRGLDFTLSNCTNNYGPFQTPEKLIPRSISLLLQNKKIQLYTDENGIAGKNVRDWLHVEDHCSAIEAIIEKGKIGETYCIGGNCELTNFQLIIKMFAEMHKITKINYEYETHVDFVKDRPGHDKRYAMSTEKIKKELDWQPNYTFETGLENTITWYLSDEGRSWLKTLEQTTNEVRKNQSKIFKGTINGN
jgi:dTDP-glucose 4,6-dehydratase